MSFRLLKIAAAVIAAATIMPVCAQQSSDRDVEDEMLRRHDALVQQRKLTGVFNYLNNMYVDQTDMAPLVERAITAMLEELDPHSSYIPSRELKGVQEQFDGEFSGIGIEFNVHRDTIMVVNVIAGAPAETVGVRPNDRIVTIDGENAVGMSRADVPSKLRGKTGSKVRVGVVRHGSDEILDFEIVRGKIPINTVDAAYRLNDSTGYVKVNRFGRTTMTEFVQAIASMGDINSLILDLRGNGGGVMEQAVEMAGFFLPQDALVVSTEGRGIKPQYFKTKREGAFAGGNVAVLIDESSASASEIVSGALQDWDRAVIIGAPSFGKGLVQRQIMLPDSSAVRITISRYHTPTGRVIQRPYENGRRDEYFQAHRDRLLNRETESDSTAVDDRPQYKTLRNGRTVYGGGGITPDIAAVQDTTMVTPYVVKLISRGLTIEYLYNLLDSERDSLTERYGTFGKYADEFEVTPAMLEALHSAATEAGIEADDEELEASRRFINRYIKAYIARTLFGNTEYWRVINADGDKAFEIAVRTLADPERLAELLRTNN